MRAPQTRRERRSRPNSSVPRKCPAVSGGRRRFGVSTVSGSASGRYGARRAARTTPTMTSVASTAGAFLPKRLLILDARVEVGVKKIDGQVDQHERQRDDEDAALHEGKIAREDT